MKKICMGIVMFATIQTTHAQNEIEALRYSYGNVPVSGRSMGMAGAFGTVGSDISSFFVNPAGIGLSKRGSVEISLGLSDQLTTTTYMNQNADNSRTHVNLNNIGLIAFTKPDDSNSKWKALNFGIAYGKTNNFYENLSIRGQAESSLMIPFAAQASGIAPENLFDNYPFSSGIAYETGGIVPTDSTGEFYVPSSSGMVRQNKNITRTGSQGETVFAFGANYNDRIHFGLALNFLSVRFTEKSVLNEDFDQNEPVTSLAFTENINSDGSGISMRFGAILRATKWLRTGVSFQTPARITMHDLYVTSMTTQINNQTYESSSPDLLTDYSIRTPSKTTVSASFILGKIGLISADYEYASYDRISMRGTTTNSYDYASENNTIRTIYRSTHQVRTGIEMRILSTYYFRAGAAYAQNPLAASSGEEVSPYIQYAGGIGYRTDHFFADLGINFTNKQSVYYMYDPAFVQAANFRTKYTNGVLSLGLRF